MIIPWRVDVPQDRRPYMNWLIIAGILVVFVVQVATFVEEITEGQPDEWLVSEDETDQEQGFGEALRLPRIRGLKVRLFLPLFTPFRGEV